MPTPTPDHRAQTAYRDVEVNIGNSGASTVCSSVGGVRYNGTGFQLLDSLGQYDPRTIGAANHATLFDMPHLLAGGSPVLNGAFKTITYYANGFVNTETWWVNSNQTAKLSTYQAMYSGGNYANPTSEVWTIFDGSTANKVIHTVTDTIGYTGVLEVSRTRSYI